MARIIPQAGSVFAPRIAAPQVFRPGRAPAKKSKAEEAAEILGLINASIATGQAVYGLGSTIAKDFAPTEAEKLAERQEATIDAGTRSAVAARKTMDQPKVDAALQAREQAVARMQDARAMGARQEGLRDAPGVDLVVPEIDPRRWPAAAPTTPPAADPWSWVPGRAPAPAAAPTPAAPPSAIGRLISDTPSSPLASKRMPTPAQVKRMADATMGMDPTGALTKRLEASILELLQRDGYVLNDKQTVAVSVLAQQRAAEAGGAPVATRRPARTRAEFLRDERGFDLSTLADSFGSLTAEGRFDEAEALLGLATSAFDYPALRTKSGQHERVLESAARKIIRAGATPEARSAVKPMTLNEYAKILGMGGRGSRGGGGGGGGGADDDAVWRIAMGAVGDHTNKKRKLTPTDKRAFAEQVKKGLFGPDAVDKITEATEAKGLEFDITKWPPEKEPEALPRPVEEELTKRAPKLAADIRDAEAKVGAALMGIQTLPGFNALIKSAKGYGFGEAEVNMTVEQAAQFIKAVRNANTPRSSGADPPLDAKILEKYLNALGTAALTAHAKRSAAGALFERHALEVGEGAGL
jgi:hypothetical protein